MLTRFTKCFNLISITALFLLLTAQPAQAKPSILAGLPQTNDPFASSSPTETIYLPVVIKAPAPISPPQQVAPLNGAILDTISPTFGFNNSAIGQPAQAQLQYWSTSDSNTIGFAPFQGDMTLRWFYNLSEATTYYWKVRSSFDNVNWGSWSEVWSFTTASGGSFPTTPDLISPADQSIVDSLRPTLTFSSVTGATDYAITVGDYIRYASPNGYTLKFDLDPDTTYTWSVSARNTYGWGPQSTEWSFTTPSAQGIVTGSKSDPTRPFYDLQNADLIFNVASGER